MQQTNWNCPSCFCLSSIILIPLTICSLVVGECCALYDEGLGRVIEDYNRPCSDCPFQYLSDAFLKGLKDYKNHNDKYR